MSLADIVKGLEELAKLVRELGRRAITEADAYKAQVSRVFNLPAEKIELMTDKWNARGKPYAEKVKIWKEIYHDWKRRHETADPSIKLRVYYAGLKAVIGLPLRYEEVQLLARYGLDRVLREKGFGVRAR